MSYPNKANKNFTVKADCSIEQSAGDFNSEVLGRVTTYLS